MRNPETFLTYLVCVAALQGCNASTGAGGVAQDSSATDVQASDDSHPSDAADSAFGADATAGDGQDANAIQDMAPADTAAADADVTDGQGLTSDVAPSDIAADAGDVVPDDGPKDSAADPCSSCDSQCQVCVAGKCKNLEGSCEDGSACTSGDACLGGTCKAGTPSDCADGDPCTLDTCAAASGCVHAAVAAGDACDDGNACSSDDTCQGGTCSGTVKSCDDGNPCTTDTCAASGACLHVNGSGACDDGSACTQGDACVGGVCVGSGTCNDGNPCTQDACDKAKGCVTLPMAGTCTDGDACTGADTCEDGACKPGSALNCDDGSACSLDACDQVKGCVYVALTGVCSDGDACTVGETCTGGKCTGGKTISCDDGNACTDDGLCEQTSGKCIHELKTGPCDDGNSCTTGDTCQAGQCSGKPTIDCNDGKPCTQDSCDGTVGCSHKFTAGGACDDNNVCTTKDVCDDKGGCVGAKVSCDDGNACTQDSCDGAGCSSINVSDGTSCGTDLACKKGVCLIECKPQPGYTADGTVNFTLDQSTGYHPYLDETWTFSLETAKSATVKRYDAPTGTFKGSFTMPVAASTYATWVISMTGEIGGPQWYFVAALSPSSTIRLARVDGPDGKIEWYKDLPGNSNPMGVFRYGSQLWLPSGDGIYGWTAANRYNPVTGENLVAVQFSGNYPYIPRAAAVVGSEVVFVGSEYLRRFSLPDLKFIDQQSLGFDSVSGFGRQNRVCATTNSGKSACFLIGKSCPP